MVWCSSALWGRGGTVQGSEDSGQQQRHGLGHCPVRGFSSPGGDDGSTAHAEPAGRLQEAAFSKHVTRCRAQGGPQASARHQGNPRGRSHLPSLQCSVQESDAKCEAPPCPGDRAGLPPHPGAPAFRKVSASDIRGRSSSNRLGPTWQRPALRSLSEPQCCCPGQVTLADAPVPPLGLASSSLPWFSGLVLTSRPAATPGAL